MSGLFFVFMCLFYVATAGRFATNDPVNEHKDEILAAHNGYRAELQISDLVWDDDLATHAQAWAQSLADANKFEHSPGDTRPGEGENLWGAGPNDYPFSFMIGGWGSEKRYFKNGIFTDVAVPGKSWEDVGHYTQIIWRNTLKVGCGGAVGD